MRPKIVIRFMPLVAAYVFITTLAAVAAPAGKPATVQGVLAAIAQVDGAMNRRDIRGLARSLAPDYVGFMLHGGVLHARDAISKTQATLPKLPADATAHTVVLSAKDQKDGVATLVRTDMTWTLRDRTGVAHVCSYGETTRQFWVQRSGVWLVKEQHDISDRLVMDGKIIKHSG